MPARACIHALLPTLPSAADFLSFHASQTTRCCKTRTFGRAPVIRIQTRPRRCCIAWRRLCVRCTPSRLAYTVRATNSGEFTIEEACHVICSSQFRGCNNAVHCACHLMRLPPCYRAAACQAWEGAFGFKARISHAQDEQGDHGQYPVGAEQPVGMGFRREPIYPSQEVSFEMGASPDALHQCGGRFKVTTRPGPWWQRHQTLQARLVEKRRLHVSAADAAMLLNPSSLPAASILVVRLTRSVDLATIVKPFQQEASTSHAQVLATDELQTFVLPANAAVGRFLRVCLHGKRQRQLEDLNFYSAMR